VKSKLFFGVVFVAINCVLSASSRKQTPRPMKAIAAYESGGMDVLKFEAEQIAVGVIAPGVNPREQKSEVTSHRSEEL
jgi:hypothetical protein